MIGQRALFDDVPQCVGLRQLFSIVINGDISKRVETQFSRHLSALSLEMKAARSEALLAIGGREDKLYTLSPCPPR